MNNLKKNKKNWFQSLLEMISRALRSSGLFCLVLRGPECSTAALKRGQIGLRAGGLHLFSLLPCVWIAALCADNGGNSCEHQSDSCTPPPPPPPRGKALLFPFAFVFWIHSRERVFTFWIGLIFRLVLTGWRSLARPPPLAPFHRCVAALSLYYSPPFIILLLKLNLTQQSGILD